KHCHYSVTSRTYRCQISVGQWESASLRARCHVRGERRNLVVSETKSETLPQEKSRVEQIVQQFLHPLHAAPNLCELMRDFQASSQERLQVLQRLEELQARRNPVSGVVGCLTTNFSKTLA